MALFYLYILTHSQMSKCFQVSCYRVLGSHVLAKYNKFCTTWVLIVVLILSTQGVFQDYQTPFWRRFLREDFKIKRINDFLVTINL